MPNPLDQDLLVRGAPEAYAVEREISDLERPGISTACGLVMAEQMALSPEETRR